MARLLLWLEVTLSAIAAGCRRPARRHGRRAAADHYAARGTYDLAYRLGVQVARDYQRGHLTVRPGLPR